MAGEPSRQAPLLSPAGQVRGCRGVDNGKAQQPMASARFRLSSEFIQLGR
jgi:hypothetical protein